MKCMEMRWLCILVSAPSEGVEAVNGLVRLLGSACGRAIREISLSAGTDSNDLLGCFEQVDIIRSKRSLVSAVQRSLAVCSAHVLLEPSVAANVAVDVAKALESSRSLLTSRFRRPHRPKQAEGSAESFTREEEAVIVQALGVLEQAAVQYAPAQMPAIEKLRQECTRLVALSQRCVTGMYEWMDGILMQAMQNGEWVLLSNVNLCSPTVLDRLNSLVETNGFIVLNERGLVDGSAQTVRPHPDFRVFMTLDPHHGELSRAMRNRGVEIAFIQPAASSQDADVLVRAALGGAFSAIGAVMTMAHLSLVDAAEQYKFKPPALRQLLRWASLVRAHLLKGRCSQMLKDCLRHSLGVCS